MKIFNWFLYIHRCSTKKSDVITVTAMGGLALGVAFLISLLGTNIVKITLSFSGVLSGPIIGIFIMGFFLPWINSVVKCSNEIRFPSLRVYTKTITSFTYSYQGAIVGAVFCYIFILWMSIGSIFFRTIPSHVVMPPITTDMCAINNSHIDISYVTESSETVTPMSSEANYLE